MRDCPSMTVWSLASRRLGCSVDVGNRWTTWPNAAGANQQVKHKVISHDPFVAYLALGQNLRCPFWDYHLIVVFLTKLGAHWGTVGVPWPTDQGLTEEAEAVKQMLFLQVAEKVLFRKFWARLEIMDEKWNYYSHTQDWAILFGNFFWALLMPAFCPLGGRVCLRLSPTVVLVEAPRPEMSMRSEVSWKPDLSFEPDSLRLVKKKRIHKEN